MNDTCKICGCTDNNPCEGGCHWIDINVCSECKKINDVVGTCLDKLYALEDRTGYANEKLGKLINYIQDNFIKLPILLGKIRKV